MPSTSADRPNIITIISDDQGAWAMGCAGAGELHTPHIDRLAREGVRYDNFYCASPVCSPARASLLTGRMPSAHGVHDWIRGEAYGVSVDTTVNYLDGLATTPESLARSGYATGFAGKWHLGTGRTPAPGFEFWYAHRTGDGPYHGAPVWDHGERATEQRYITDAITDESLDFLGGCVDDPRPFYLTTNYTAPHSPWVDQHPQQYLDIYADAEFSACPREPVHPWFSWEPGPVSDAMQTPRPSLQGYYAALTAMDAGIGRLLRFLDSSGLRESTVVVFTSDNGFSCGHHGIWGKGNATWPLNVWEESVKVPFIISQPGTLPQGSVDRQLASACDLHPTLLDLAGVAAPDDPLAAGSTLLAPSRGAQADPRETVMVFDEYGGTRMVRSNDWKYVTRAAGPTELYHLSEDPAERHNRAHEPAQATRLDELHGVLHDWFEAHSHPPPLDAFDRPVSGRGQLQPATNGDTDSATYHQGEDEIRLGGGPSEHGEDPRPPSRP